MGVSNLKTQASTVLFLFTLCNYLGILIFAQRKPISEFLASYLSINEEDKTYSLVNYLIFMFIAGLHFPFILAKIQDTIVPTYSILYVVFTTVMIIINPWDILTINRFTLWVLMVFTPLLFVMIKLAELVPYVGSVLVLLCITLLNVSGENMIRAVYEEPTTLYLYFIVYCIMYVFGYMVALRKAPLEMSNLPKLVMPVAKKLEFSKINPILLGIISVIIVYFYIRNATKQYYGGNLLLSDPVSLNTSTAYKIKDKSYEYTVSFWIYLDGAGPNYNKTSARFTPIFQYGQNLSLSYHSENNVLRMSVQNEDKKVHTHDITPILQKWTQVMFMYSNGTLDTFINGELVDSFVIITNPSTHDIVIGSNRGVRGRICTLLYYNKVISIETRRQLYSQFKDKTPPTL